MFPVLVFATQVYRPASSGFTCWKTSAKESSSSPSRTLNLSSGSKVCPSRFHENVGFSPLARSPSPPGASSKKMFLSSGEEIVFDDIKILPIQTEAYLQTLVFEGFFWT